MLSVFSPTCTASESLPSPTHSVTYEVLGTGSKRLVPRLPHCQGRRPGSRAPSPRRVDRCAPGLAQRFGHPAPPGSSQMSSIGRRSMRLPRGSPPPPRAARGTEYKVLVPGGRSNERDREDRPVPLDEVAPEQQRDTQTRPLDGYPLRRVDRGDTDARVAFVSRLAPAGKNSRSDPAVAAAHGR